MISCPRDQCLIDFSRISPPLLIFSYPDTDIELSCFELFFVGRNFRYDVEITIRFRELSLKLMNIDSSIHREWDENTPNGFDAGSREMGIGIKEEGHSLADIESFKFFPLKTDFCLLHRNIYIKIFSDVPSEPRFLFEEKNRYIIGVGVSSH